MITNNDLNVLKLSPTKKDFYQIWNELLDTAKKLSERWDPTATNESDPGIILLKVLTAVADKINYNIDKNILEAFMPSAAQEESMRKLCDMLGYTMKYYQSAETDVTIAYVGDKAKLQGKSITLPIFTAITDQDKEINYFTTEAKTFTADGIIQTIPCMEGQIVQCESDNDNIISMNQIDDWNRYYLPETQIAENGIFIYSIKERELSKKWDKKDNLNVVNPGTPCYKFEYDSKEERPYIQFPDDVSQLIGDGLEIYYARTSGINGNIKARQLSLFDIPNEWNQQDTESTEEESTEFVATDFLVKNEASALNGKNPESITSAYNNFKKTVGTFDTLVTCRDYMNKIYQLFESNIPVVSNIIVSDIRDDINSSITICNFDDYGISYSAQGITRPGSNKTIDHFDLKLYPFNTVYGVNDKNEYINSFEYDPSAISTIQNHDDIKNCKTISHKFNTAFTNDIICIKNYLKLNARITTTYKVIEAEADDILSNIKTAIYSAFNLRQLDFGEEIPFDSILECIEGADSRIKNVSLDEPDMYTTFVVNTENSGIVEYSLASKDTDNLLQAKKYFNWLVLRNILAGRIALFDYNNAFKYNFTETLYPSWTESSEIKSYKPIYGAGSETSSGLTDADTITKIQAGSEIPIANISEQHPAVLTKNEVIKFRSPNLKTIVTYPAYVNYYLHLEQATGAAINAIPASFITLKEFISKDYNSFTNLFNNLVLTTTDGSVQATTAEEALSSIKASLRTIAARYAYLFAHNEYHSLINIESLTENDIEESEASEGTWKLKTSIDYVKIEDYDSTTTNYNIIKNWVSNQIIPNTTDTHYLGIFYKIGQRSTYNPGYLVDVSSTKYNLSTLLPYNSQGDSYYNICFIQNVANDNITYGLGRDGKAASITNGEEYQLQPNEYLLINYKPASSADSTSNDNVLPINRVYTNPTIIKPNFNLEDSWQAHTISNKGFVKTNNNGYEFKNYPNIEGLFTLGPNEQIEIRDLVDIKLTDTYNNVFMLLNNPESLVLQGNTNRYILEENEYVFYTDENKLELAYYGPGTEISYNADSSKSIICKDFTAKDLTLEAILENGINAIPWQILRGSETEYLHIIEYQYRTLTEGDKLNSISLETASDKLSATWTACSAANYTFSSSDNPEPLPPYNLDGRSWEVASFLDFNLGPNTVQKLSSNDYITLTFKTGDPVTLTAHEIDGHTVDLSVQSNVTIQSAKTQITVNPDKLLLGFKVFKEEPAGKVAGANINELGKWHNLNNYWTSVTFDTLSESEQYIKLNIVVPQNSYGLMMFYYNLNASTSAESESSYIQLEDTSSSLSIFNYKYDSGDTWATPADCEWWHNLSDNDNNKYYFKKGINVIKFNEDKNYTIKIYPDKDKKGSITFSDLDIIKDSTDNLGLNINLLKYSGIDTDYSSAEQLLKDLFNTLSLSSSQFYYNCWIGAGDIIDLNTSLLGDSSEENMQSATAWYNKNNINNKFVISEIDPDHLDKGLTIIKSSKL